MSNKHLTRCHNLDFFKNELGLDQINSSSVFRKNDYFFISPSVSSGQHGKYWMDIREANLNKVDRQNCFFLPRIYKDIFILTHLSQILCLLSHDAMENRRNSGNVWGVYMQISNPPRYATLVCKKIPEIKLELSLLSKVDVKNSYMKIMV